MKSKLIFLDIDGTLTAPGSNVPPESALAAIRAAQKAGHKVFLCSGRNYDMLSPLLRYHFDGAVASGGGYVFAGEQVLYDCPMSEAQKDAALRLLKDGGSLWLEINASLAAETAALFTGAAVIQDINGKDRFIVVKK